MARARRQLQQAQTEDAAQAAAALQGSRPSLTREAVSADAAAEQLLTAEAYLSSNPELEAACCSRVEVDWGQMLFHSWPYALVGCHVTMPLSC